MPEDKERGQPRSGVRSCYLLDAKAQSEERELDPGSWSQSHSSPPGFSIPICKMGALIPTFLQSRAVGGSKETRDQIPFTGKCFGAPKAPVRRWESITWQPCLLIGQRLMNSQDQLPS